MAYTQKEWAKKANDKARNINPYAILTTAILWFFMDKNPQIKLLINAPDI